VGFRGGGETVTGKCKGRGGGGGSGVEECCRVSGGGGARLFSKQPTT